MSQKLFILQNEVASFTSLYIDRFNIYNFHLNTHVQCGKYLKK